MHLHGSHQITSGLDSVGMLKVRKYLLKDSIEVALVAFYTVQKYVSNAFLELLVVPSRHYADRLHRSVMFLSIKLDKV